MSHRPKCERPNSKSSQRYQKYLHDLGIGKDSLNGILTMKSTNPKEDTDNTIKIFLFQNTENENAKYRGRQDLQYIYIRWDLL